MAVAETEVLVAGGGVAALTAAFFAARHGHETSVLTGGLGAGGSLLSIGRIEDFPGFPDGVPGYDLCPMIQEQATAAGADFRMASIEGLTENADGWSVATSEGAITARAVILATGSRLRRLGISGEEELTGKGVSQCATCDGPLARDAIVAVVGGGDSALLETLELTHYASRVLLFQRGGSLDGQAAYRSRVLEHPAVTIHFESVVEEIVGDDRVTGLRVRDQNGITHHDASAVFVYIGVEPNTDFLAPPLELDADGRIPTDVSLRTSCRGVFAAGDIRIGSAGQAVAAAGDGATAAVAAHRFLNDRNWPAHSAERERPPAVAL